MQDSSPRLSHLNPRGEVHMVEVGDRPATDRRAVAEGFIAIAPPVLASILSGTAAKGDVRIDTAYIELKQSALPAAPAPVAGASGK
jgi:molybdenum cofactor biosynthesis enzyme